MSGVLLYDVIVLSLLLIVWKAKRWGKIVGATGLVLCGLYLLFFQLS